jgi:hypothetical protein
MRYLLARKLRSGLVQWNNLSTKEGSLFSFVVMRSTELGCFRLCTWCLWKALNKKGCICFVPRRLELRCKSSGILNDFFTEI